MSADIYPKVPSVNYVTHLTKSLLKGKGVCLSIFLTQLDGVMRTKLYPSPIVTSQGVVVVTKTILEMRRRRTLGEVTVPMILEVVTEVVRAEVVRAKGVEVVGVTEVVKGERLCV